MNLQTSANFVSAAASGEGWRDISKKVLEQLESVRTPGFQANIGFLYVTEHLLDDASSILTLFKSVTGVSNWTGCAAYGVCAPDAEYIDKPAISVMIGHIPDDNFRIFHAAGNGFKKLHQDLEPWLNRHDPMLVFLQADPASPGAHPAAAIEEIDSLMGGFMIGGLTSSRPKSLLFSRDAHDTGVSGVAFDSSVAVATTLSQGCHPMRPGGFHEITKAEGNVIVSLDKQQPFAVMSEDMRFMAEEKLGHKPEEMILSGDFRSEKDFPAGLLTLLNGEMHVAFPVEGSDQNDYMVRNIMAIDPQNGSMAVSERVEPGQKIMFVHRTDESLRADLSHSLVSLQKRVVHDTGMFAPRGAVYISCVARAHEVFGAGGVPGGEMALIREVLGDVPLTGFYAGGEISGNRLYAYTGVLLLFL